MEIQKVFSDEYDEERYYSVLMNEEEVVLFSELQKEFGFLDGVKGFFGGNKKKIKELTEEVAKQRAAASEASIARHQMIADKLRMKRNLKIGGKVALGVAGAAGLGYGIKKLYDRNKKKNVN